jgi:hypothetical protein
LPIKVNIKKEEEEEEEEEAWTMRLCPTRRDYVL